MELLFVTLGGIVLGLIARYSLPWRQSHGLLLLPAVGGMVSAVIWVGLTWLGWAWDGGWIWWVALGGTAVVVAAAGLLIGRIRSTADERLRVRLGA